MNKKYLISFAWAALASTCMMCSGPTPLTTAPLTSKTPTPTPTLTPTPTPVPVAGAWHSTVAVGGVTADFGTLAYAPGGSAYVQYSILGAGSWALSNAIQTGNSSFAAANSISANDQQANLFFVNASTIWASAESATTLHIYKSTDSGSTWVLQKSYPALANGAGGPANYRSGWVDNGGGDLQVFFGVQYHNGVLGDHDEVHTLAFSTGSWAAADISPDFGAYGAMQGVFSSGSNVLVSNTGVSYSQNSGATYTAEQVGGTLDQNIYNVGGIARNANTIYAANTYSYGVMGVDQHYAVWKSNDFGKTWTKVFATSGEEWRYDFPTIAVVGNLVVMGVVQEAVGGSGSPQIIKYITSGDAGATWNSETQIIDVSTLGNVHVVGLQLSASSNGRIGAVYSLEAGATGSGLGGAGVYFEEFY